MNELIFSRVGRLSAASGWHHRSVTADEHGMVYELQSDVDARQPGRRRERHRLLDVARGDVILETTVMDERLCVVQPFGDDFLLAGVAAGPGGPTGMIVDASGATRRSIDLGVGIQDVQVAGEEIWVSYFDEGVFSAREEPGLARYDATGSRTFSFRDVATSGTESASAPVDEDAVPSIADCYALNVIARNNVWLYYYTEFPLVHLEDDRVKGCWRRTPVMGARAVAVREPFVLFSGSYDAPERLVRFDTRTGEAVVVRPSNIIGADVRTFARGARVYVVRDDSVWQAEI